MLSEQHHALSNLPLKPQEKITKNKENLEFLVNVTSVADPECSSGFRISDPTFSIPDPGSEFFPSQIRIPDPHQRI
jgi:hypothetical protein